MARGRNAVDDSSEEEVSKNKKSIEVEDEDEGSEEEEEYEIEAILDAKQGAFEGGEIGYFVKWKNYDESHNSWVKESDAGNAQDLIDEYYRKQPKTKKVAGRKSDVKSTVSSFKKRKSSPSVSDTESAPAPKKRGRPPKKTSVSEDEDEIEEVPPPKTKASKKGASGGASARSKRKASPEPMDEDEVYQDMSKWKDAASWNHLVESVDTVERQDDGKLYVYFRLKAQKGGEGALCREPSEICKKKMPDLLLNFYEQNLRWRPLEEE